MIWIWLACTDPVDTGQVDSADTGETGETGVEPLEPQVDVLVIGSGAAGLIAARAAQEQGATVLVLEMADSAGGGAHYARRMLAVGSTIQQNKGVPDSVEVALEEWEAFTGAEPDATVERFLEDSGGIVDDLQDRYGALFTGPEADRDSGETPRIHMLESESLAEVLLWDVTDVRLEARADELIVQDGRVVGVRVTDMATDAVEDIGAHTVIVATGGFARDLDRVRQDRPGLADALLMAEMHPYALGLGHDMLEDAGAGWQNAGGYGVYAHSLIDDGDGALLNRARNGLVVDADGNRLFDEIELNYFGAAHVMEALTPPRLIFLASEGAAQELSATHFDYTPDITPASSTVDELLAAGVLTLHDDVDDLALAYDLGQDIVPTIAAYDAAAQAGEDPEFGKHPDFLHAFGDGPIVAGEIAAGAAKAFVGVPLGDDGAVLDVDGDPIPGVYAAGEVAGMLGTDAVGRGFTGSVTAVLWTGERAGRQAALEALER